MTNLDGRFGEAFTMKERKPLRRPFVRAACLSSRFRKEKEQFPMNPKPRPNHKHYLEVLRNMTPEQRLLKAFELSAFCKALFREGLRRRFPDLPEEEFHKLFLARLALCHNRNY